jgi:hypothetical protein
MQKIGIFLLLTTITFQAYCQDTAVLNENGKSAISTDNEQISTKVVIGNDLISFEDGEDALNLRVGNKGIKILESLEGHKIGFVNYNNEESVYQDEPKETEMPARKNFKGHWSAIEFGYNNYVTANRSMVLPDDIYYMSIHSGKSSNFNLNFAQLSLGISRHIGIVTGLGLNINNYKFEGNNNIIKGPTGIIEPYLPPDGVFLAKSKLTVSFITVPVLLEIQIPAGNKSHLNIAAGPIAAAKVGSHSKIVYEASKQKVKDNSDFSLSMLRYGATVRAGYGNLQLYGTYYFTSLFKTGKGAELYPFEIGVSFSFEG